MEAQDINSKETLGFQAEVKQLLQLMIHSLYSNKEIFLRELISNASDACDKLRYEAIANPDLIAVGAPPKIRIVPGKKANTLSVLDSGIGMDRQELIDNLGTIARSGTKSFLSRLTEAKDGANLIGQFGVGFYAAFMVAERIVVFSRRAGTEQTWSWSSSGGSGFEIAPAGEEDAADRFMQISYLGEARPRRSPMARLRAAFGNSGHRWMYDEAAMTKLLRQAGLTAIRTCSFGDAPDRMFDRVEEEGRFFDSGNRELAMEARRPS